MSQNPPGARRIGTRRPGGAARPAASRKVYDRPPPQLVAFRRSYPFPSASLVEPALGAFRNEASVLKRQGDGDALAETADLAFQPFERALRVGLRFDLIREECRRARARVHCTARNGTISAAHSAISF